MCRGQESSPNNPIRYGIVNHDNHHHEGEDWGLLSRIVPQQLRSDSRLRYSFEYHPNCVPRHSVVYYQRTIRVFQAGTLTSYAPINMTSHVSLRTLSLKTSNSAHGRYIYTLPVKESLSRTSHSAQRPSPAALYGLGHMLPWC